MISKFRAGMSDTCYPGLSARTGKKMPLPVTGVQIGIGRRYVHCPFRDELPPKPGIFRRGEDIEPRRTEGVGGR